MCACTCVYMSVTNITIYSGPSVATIIRSVDFSTNTGQCKQKKTTSLFFYVKSLNVARPAPPPLSVRFAIIQWKDGSGDSLEKGSFSNLVRKIM